MISVEIILNGLIIKQKLINFPIFRTKGLSFFTAYVKKGIRKIIAWKWGSEKLATLETLV